MNVGLTCTSVSDTIPRIIITQLEMVTQIIIFPALLSGNMVSRIYWLGPTILMTWQSICH